MLPGETALAAFLEVLRLHGLLSRQAEEIEELVIAEVCPLNGGFGIFIVCFRRRLMRFRDLMLLPFLSEG